MGLDWLLVLLCEERFTNLAGQKFHVQLFKKEQWAHQQFYCHFAFCQYLKQLDNCYESKQFTTLRAFLCEGNKQIVHFKLQSCFRRAINFLEIF